jgi:hypothetical protein
MPELLGCDGMRHLYPHKEVLKRMSVIINLN